jgi:acetoin utilization deacetylase AcuC-like enzyme
MKCCNRHIEMTVGILDCDAHFGDGTQDIIDQLNLEDRVAHWTYGRDVRSRFEDQVRQFIDDFARQSELGRRILFYQAGADVHIDDPLGPGVRHGMTDEAMRTRDRMIFTACRDLDIPIVWNLAGGYQRDRRGGISRVLELHRATMEECVQCFAAVKIHAEV